MDKENHVGPYERLKDKLNKVGPYNSRYCIYRVPPRLRRVNKMAYTPQDVSIGPIHHGEGLEIMKEHKLRFLNDFLGRTRKELDHYIGIVKEKEDRIRGCYEETFDELSSDEFVTIILVDAVFIVELFLTAYSREIGLPVEKKRVSIAERVLYEVWQDLLLLENQLPFFILENIWNYAAPSIPMILIFGNYLSSGFELNLCDLVRIFAFSEKPEHLVDLLRKIYIPLHPTPTTKAEPFQAPKIDQFLKWVRKPRNLKTSKDLERFHAPTVTQLRQAGLEFRLKSESRSLLDISYSEGTLKIPKWTITDSTEVNFRNLIAFEQCHCEDDKHYICHYRRLMDYLIDTPMDVDLLVKEGIIENWLGESNDVSTMINKQGYGVNISQDDFYFADIFGVLNEHCGSSWYEWKANLKQNYFNTPWAYLSFLAALFLLILTTIQTVCSVISTS